MSLSEGNDTFDIQEELKKLPEKPGVYIMKNKDDLVLYVGKAVILKNRVKSYFQKTSHSARISRMISHISSFEYIITDSEYEALLLENNLIKKLMPPYNVLLKDDKGFPYIVVTKEDFPRILLARRTAKDGNKYFGPYFSSWTVNTTLDAIKNILPTKRCSKKISADDKLDARPCLNYHIGLCPGVCCGKITKDEYAETIKDVCSFLSGHYDKIEQKIKNEMLQAAAKEDFEKAALYRDRLKALSKLAEKQKIENTAAEDFDVAAVAKGSIDACMQIFFIRAGKITGRDYYIFEGGADEDEAELTEEFIKQFYRECQYIPPKIYIGCELPEDKKLLDQWLSQIRGAKCEIFTPIKGYKKNLIQLVKDNAALVLTNKAILGNDGQKRMELLEQLAQALDIDVIPERIEAYDISNLGESEINASMVVFTSAAPSKQDYKRFKMKTITAQNDVGSIKEVLTRRFNRYAEGSDGFNVLPDLILIDGGRNQCAVAEEVIHEFNLPIEVFGMVKDDRHRTRAITNSEDIVIDLKHDIDLWRFISSIQNEAHRFAIEYNRKLTAKRYKKSALDGIPSIGNKRKVALLRAFGSISGIRNATKEQLLEVEGMTSKAADNLIKALQQNSKETK